jgi:hypothetical protein
MKKIKYLGLALALVMTLNACEQEVMELQDPDGPSPECPDDATAGSANFSKFIAIGNSFVAGVQGGALFTEGQNNSLPAILNRQFECVGAPETFNQPTIGASLGYNLFVPQPALTDDSKPVLGRMLLQYGSNVSCATGAPSPVPTPQAYPVGEAEALPDPSQNPGFIYGNGSTKASLNNFAVPALFLGQSLIPETGKWSGAGVDPRFNPFYGRLAFPGNGTSTIIGDAAASGGTFFLFWLGMDDFLLHAAFGADPTKAPLTPPIGGLPNGFDGQYGAAVGSLLASNAELKGVVGNFPDIFKMPHFTLVAYNPIPLDGPSATALTNGFAGYNAALDGLIANKAAFGISDELAAEIETRKASFTAGCNNKILLVDESLTDLGPYFDGLRSANAINDAQRAALVPYEQVRQTTPTDVIPLSTGSVLGKPGTFGLLGVSEPVGDQYVIIPTERDQINATREAYNAVVAGVVAAFPGRLALADVEVAIDGFTAAKIEDNVLLTPNLNPPTGIYSEDGIHFNTRGYAFIANVFIDAINATYDASVPSVNLGNYKATGLPIP